MDLDTTTKRNSKRFSLIPRLGSSSGKEQKQRPMSMDASTMLKSGGYTRDGPSEQESPRLQGRYEPPERVIGRDYTPLAPTSPIPYRTVSGASYITKPYPNRAVSGITSDYGGTITSSNAGSMATSMGDRIPFETPWPVYTAEQEAAVEYSRDRGQVQQMPKPTEQEKRIVAERQRKAAESNRKLDDEERRRVEKERKRQSRIPVPDDMKKDFSKEARPSTASKVMGFFRRKH